MQYIKVLATDSTNDDLKRLSRNNVSMPNTCLRTDRQLKGKGQMNGVWNTEHGKNLTMSIFLRDLRLKVSENFHLSALVSLAVATYIQEKTSGLQIKVKWPNDILAGRQKLCGILIENLLKGSFIERSIIGVGLNVNQMEFGQHTQAGSLRELTGKNWDLDLLQKELSEKIENTVYQGLKQPYEHVIKTYEAQLFRLNQPSKFLLPSGEQQTGVIRGIQFSGRMLVEFDNGLQSFGLKEIKLLY